MNIHKLIVGPIRTNCYIIASENELAVIDPGDDAGMILDKITELGGRLKFIINTHYHFDHISANNEVKRATGAPVMIHEREKDYADFCADAYLREGDKIKIGNIDLEIKNLPGHSKGSICLAAKDVIFSGDLIFENGYGRTDLDGGSPSEMRESLSKLKDLLKPGMMVFPGHGKEFRVPLP
jgi:hydroxyacylglutathione hydrolase